MRSRRAMLRSFVAEQYASAPFHDVVQEAASGPLAQASPEARVQASLVPMLLPHLVEAVEQVILHAAEQPKVRGFAGGLLTYVYNPLDLLQGEGMLGWLDDAIVCALGLHKLSDAGLVALDKHTAAVVAIVTASVPALSSELRSAIEAFLAALWESNGQVAVAAQPA